MRKLKRPGIEGVFAAGAVAVGLAAPAIAAAIGLWCGARAVAAHGYLGQGLVMIAARTLVEPVLDLVPAGLALGVVLSALYAGALGLSRAQQSPPRAAILRALGWIALTGALWVVVRLLAQPGAGGVQGAPGWAPGLTLAAAAAGVWVLARIRSGSQRVVRWAVRLAGAFVVLVLLVSAGVALARRSARPAGPSVILIAVDTLRYDHLGFAGYERPTSPALDALAAESVSFERAYSSAPWTSPAIATLLTSRYPAELGYTDSRAPARLDERELLLPEILSDRGYATDAIVSHTYVAESLGFDQGFDSFDSSNALGHHHVSSPSLLAKALAKLDERRGRPFFLFLHFFDPHFAYIQQDDFDFDPHYTGTIVSNLDYGRLLAEAPVMEEADIRHVEALYDSEIAGVDLHLERLLAGLEERGLADDCLIVFTADHGEAFLDRDDDWIGHGITLYDELIRVPLLMRPPGGLEDGLRIREVVSLADVAPTILRALDVAVPAGWRPEGRPLPLGGSEGLGERTLFAETMARGRWLQAVLWREWKLVHDRRDGSSLLFDLAADPGEKVDAAAEWPDLRRRLEGALGEWHRRQQEARGGRTVETADFTDQQREQLEALGYIE